MKLTIVAAIGKNRELGKNNDLIWHLPADLKHFKSLTTGAPIIMGRKTYESIGRPLPNRKNIIISRNPELQIPGCFCYTTIADAKASLAEGENAFLIGGGQLYKQYINEMDQLEITEVKESFDADIFFPEIDQNIWMEQNRIANFSDEKNPHDFDFVTYIKR
jgi:dihydrofolate reductase